MNNVEYDNVTDKRGFAAEIKLDVALGIDISHTNTDSRAVPPPIWTQPAATRVENLWSSTPASQHRRDIGPRHRRAAGTAGRALHHTSPRSAADLLAPFTGSAFVVWVPLQLIAAVQLGDYLPLLTAAVQTLVAGLVWLLLRRRTARSA